MPWWVSVVVAAVVFHRAGTSATYATTLLETAAATCGSQRQRVFGRRKVKPNIGLGDQTRTVTVAVLLAVMLFPISSHGGIFGAANYAECILDEMPGASNDLVAQHVIILCHKRFPAGLQPVDRREFFPAYKSGRECLIDKASNTSNTMASQVISAACYRLYGPST